MENNFFIVFDYVYIYINASLYDNALFSLFVTFTSQIELYVLQSTLVLSFCMDVVFTLPIQYLKIKRRLMGDILYSNNANIHPSISILN